MIAEKLSLLEPKKLLSDLFELNRLENILVILNHTIKDCSVRIYILPLFIQNKNRHYNINWRNSPLQH
jgi:hypothetical protein